MKDRREYAMFAVDLPSNPKMAGASPLTRWLDVCAVLYAARHFTDGHVHGQSILAEAVVPKKHLTDLVNRGRLHPLGHECPRCPQPREEGWLYVHDYLIHQRSAEQAQAQRAAGAKAARARWDADRNANRIADRTADGNAESESEVSVVKEVGHLSLADARAIDGLDLGKIATALGSTEAWAAQVAVGIIGRSKESVRAPTAYVLDSIEREPTKHRPPKQAPSDTPFKRLCTTHGKDRAQCGCPARKRRSA